MTIKSVADIIGARYLIATSARPARSLLAALLAFFGAIVLAPDGRTQTDSINDSINRLRGRDVDVRQEAVDALAAIGEPAIGPLIAVARDSDFGVRTWAAKALVAIGKSAVEPMIAALQDSDAAARCSIITALGNMKDTRAVRPLIERLSDPDSYAFSLFGRRFYVRTCTAGALGRINDPRSANALRTALAEAVERRDFEMMMAAASPILSRKGDASAKSLLDLLIMALQDHDAQMRYNAACALGKIRDPGTVDALIVALKDRSYYVDNSGLYGSNAHLYVGTCVANALGQFKAVRAVEPLIDALKDKTFGGRFGVARALGEVDDPRSTAALRAALVERDATVIGAAYQALIKRGDRASEEALIQGLKAYGNAQMALVFINSGNARLADAGRDWADSHGYRIVVAQPSGPEQVRWGSAR